MEDDGAEKELMNERMNGKTVPYIVWKSTFSKVTFKSNFLGRKK
jgi:hypothetical protein